MHFPVEVTTSKRCNMYWIIDVIVIAIVLSALIIGVKRGFLRMVGGLLSFVLAPVLTVAGIGLFILLLYKLGVVDQMTLLMVKVIGETNSLFGLMHIESYDVAYYLGLVVLAIIGFIISYILVILLFKGLSKAMQNCGKKGAVRVIDAILGVIIRLVICAAIILGLFAVIHALKDTLAGLDELLRACPLSGLIYKHNPFNELMADVLSGFIG